MRHVLVTLVLACAASCSPSPAPITEAHADEEAAPITNRISIPEAVRANLGITFARVESRAVAATLRVPGRFEALPAATWPYRAHSAGRVTSIAAPFSEVQAGDVLFRLESPEWLEELQAVRDVRTAETAARARLAVLDELLATQAQALAAVDAARAHWDGRVAELVDLLASGAGVADQLAEARGEAVAAAERAAQARFERSELEAERASTRNELERLTQSARSSARAAAARIGIDAAAFESALVAGDASLGALEVRAVRAGRVTDVAAEVGSWVETGAPLVTVVDKSAVLFRASVLQSDIGLLREGATCSIAAPVVSERTRSIGVGQSVAGRLHVAPTANAHDNTIDVFVEPLESADWARPGVFARLEFEYDSTVEQVLSVPLSAIQRDGLVPVLFRRDPQDPDRVIRIEADIGLDDGRWIEIASGVRAGDEVVLDGAFQLLLASSGSMQKGGHFHADGTFHEGED
jgi:RND family efflux transporter MFP subunit